MLNVTGNKRMTIVHDDDLPVGMKKRQRLAHQIAEQACKQVWNIAIDENQKLDLQVTGNEALSYMGTILQDFAGRWLVLMDGIRMSDDAGVLREDLVKNLINGILATIGCSANYEKDEPLPNGIKRLTKENDNERI